MNNNVSLNSRTSKKDQSFDVSKSMSEASSRKDGNKQDNVIEGPDLDQTLDPSRIMEYIQLLKEYEQQCIQEGNFNEAELVVKRIEELQQHELVYRSLAVVEKNKEEISELEKLNLDQFNEFNEIWDQIIEEHVQHLKKLEENMIEQHKREQSAFENEVSRVQIPKCKYSREVLNMRFVLENMIKTKKFIIYLQIFFRYAEAADMKQNIEQEESKQEQIWNKKYMEKYDKKKLQVWQRQKNEIEALKVKLENSLQEKIKIRTVELEKLLQKFQNMKNELEVKQNQELSKLQVMNSKTMIKLQTNRSMNQSIYSTGLDTSKINY